MTTSLPTSSDHTSMQDSAPVSVVIPCYRCADTIDRALASVRQQTWRPAEVIMVEDGSGDGTLKRLQELQADYSEDWLKVLALPRNVGPGAARNAGWDKARQPYIAFLDSDDAWHPEKIRLQLGWMLAHPEIALTGHALEVVHGEQYKNEKEFSPLEFKRISSLAQLLIGQFHPPAMVLRKDLQYRFAENKRQSEDRLLAAEISLDGHACYRSATPLAFIFKEHYGTSGLSGNLWLGEKGELDFYVRLARSGRISRFSLLLFFPFSLAKFVRRLLKVAFRRCFERAAIPPAGAST